MRTRKFECQKMPNIFVSSFYSIFNAAISLILSLAHPNSTIQSKLTTVFHNRPYREPYLWFIYLFFLFKSLLT